MSALLQDGTGRAIVAGGLIDCYYDCSDFNPAEIFDPKSATWTIGSFELFKHDRPVGAALFGGKFFIASANVSQIVDVNTSMSVEGPALQAEPVDRIDLKSDTLVLLQDGSLFRTVVYISSEPATTTLMCNGSSIAADQCQQWVHLGVMRRTRVGFALVVTTHGDVIAVGGTTYPMAYAWYALNSTEIFSPSSAVFPSTPPSTSPGISSATIALITCLLVGGAALVAGGLYVVWKRRQGHHQEYNALDAQLDVGSANLEDVSDEL